MKMQDFLPEIKLTKKFNSPIIFYQIVSLIEYNISTVS